MKAVPIAEARAIPDSTVCRQRSGGMEVEEPEDSPIVSNQTAVC